MTVAEKLSRDLESITDRDLVALLMDAPVQSRWYSLVSSELRGRMGRNYVREVSDLEASIDAERNAPTFRYEPDWDSIAKEGQNDI